MNKINHDLTVEKITSQIKLNSAFIGDKFYEVGSLDDIEHPKALNDGRVGLKFAPPLDTFKSDDNRLWSIEGVVYVSFRLGNVSKSLKKLESGIKKDDLFIERKLLGVDLYDNLTRV